jgi:hypothetical protein
VEGDFKIAVKLAHKGKKYFMELLKEYLGRAGEKISNWLLLCPHHLYIILHTGHNWD